ncbi:MAG: phosphoglucosamine mutase [Defluviitaleaceae bacterium]|nr:phosphoglucosamine mutase [Defluviitaleaceae bacterium]
MPRLFGTDGVRGVANGDLTPEAALRLGRAGAYTLTRHITGGAPKIILGTDTRRSGGMLESALAAGLCSAGADVHRAGVIPTPGISYLVKRYGYDAGVMITASHNLMADNGVKFFNFDGYKLPDEMEDEIEAAFNECPADMPRPVGTGVGVITDCESAAYDYVNFLVSAADGIDLSGFKIALDCANGSVHKIAPAVFEMLGAQTYCVNFEPDGANINLNCGSTHMEPFYEYIKSNGFDAGFSFDGDGDRCLCADENGAAVDGDQMMAICGADMQRAGKLAKNEISATIMSNMGLVIFCKNHGITLHQSAVGDRYVLEKMLADGLNFGGEQSGHLIFREYAATGDGILSALMIMSVMRRTGQKLSQLKQVMEVLPQFLINVPIKNESKPFILTHPQIAEAIDEAVAELAGEGRVLVRPSGTEPKARVMLEGRNRDQIEKLAKKIAEKISVCLGEHL